MQAHSSTRSVPAFDALDDCHRQIQQHLLALAALAEHLQHAGVDAHARQEADRVERFFSQTARPHHAQEEQQVFPALLQHEDAEVRDAVRSLQQDHGWIEENWLALGPLLRGMADGSTWVDEQEFQHGAEVFLALCRAHIALEESLIYPESKAQWALTAALRQAPKPWRKRKEVATLEWANRADRAMLRSLVGVDASKSKHSTPAGSKQKRRALAPQ